MSANEFFLDTNILVYCYDNTSVEKHSKARSWLEYLWRSRSGRISSHIISEFYHVVTRKVQFGISSKAARDIISDYSAWHPLSVSVDTIMLASEIQDEFILGWWDCLAIAAAQQQRCTYFLSEDLQDRQKIMGVTIINPLLLTPEQI